jgi:hypothetical protein
MYTRAHRGTNVSSRIEDLRDLARMLDEGKISQSEYDIVKKDLLNAPSEEWLSAAVISQNDSSEEPTEVDDLPDGGAGRWGGWLAMILGIPTTYRLALVGAVLVLVVGGVIATRTDATGTIPAVPRSQTTIPAAPPDESLGVGLEDLAEGWNAVEDPPRISGGIVTSPEPGPLDSFLHRFNDSALLAGAYDPGNGYISGLMVSSSLHYAAAPNLYVHVCYLLHPGSQPCLEMYVEETGLFGKGPSDLIGTEKLVEWEFEGTEWRFEVADDIQTIRVQATAIDD